MTHDARGAARAQRVLFMADGKIVEEMALPGKEKGEREERVGFIRKEMEKNRHIIGLFFSEIFETR